MAEVLIALGTRTRQSWGQGHYLICSLETGLVQMFAQTADFARTLAVLVVAYLRQGCFVAAR